VISAANITITTLLVDRYIPTTASTQVNASGILLVKGTDKIAQVAVAKQSFPLGSPYSCPTPSS